MIRFIRTFFVLWAFGVASFAMQPQCPSAQTGCPSLEERLVCYINSPDFNAFLRRNGLHAGESKVTFVVQDHRSADWHLIRMKRARDAEPDGQPKREFILSDLDVKEIAFSADGIPDVQAGSSDRIAFVLANTNIALYSLDKSVAREDVPELAKLKQIISAVAGLTRDIVIRRGRAQTSLAGAGAEIEALELLPSDLLDDLRSAAEQLRLATQRVENSARQITTRLQYAEFGEATTEKLDFDEHREVFKAVLKAIQEFDRAGEQFRDHEFVVNHSCQPAVVVLQKASFDESMSAEETSAHIASLKRELLGTACDSDAVRLAAQIIDSSDEALINNYLANAALIEAVLTWAQDLAGTTPDLLSNAAVLVQFTNYYERLNPEDDACRLTHGILVADSADEVLLDQLGIATVSIGELAPLGATYVRRGNASGERKYRFAHRASKSLAYGVGIVHTPISDPSYSAIENPLNAAEKVVARTGEKSRTGDLALLASYRFRPDASAFRPGIQFGVGLTEETPLYLGGSLDLGRYLRFGAGITAQRVTALDDGYTAMRRNKDGSVDPESLTTIGADDAVPTRDRVTTGFYAALVVTLDGIPFFEEE